MPRPQTGYLYQRPGSANWWIKLQYPPASGRKKVQKSLGTKDRREAELLALPMIQQHKRDLWEAVNRKRGHVRLAPDGVWLYPLGKTTQADGTVVFATENEVMILHPDGTREERVNGKEVVADFAFDPDNHPPGATILPLPRNPPIPIPKPKKPDTTTDLKLLDDFLNLQPRSPHYITDARRVWARWHAFVENRPLSKCTRDDGRAFVAHLRALDPVPAPVTIRKWLSLIKAPIAHGLPKHDPAQDIFHKLLGKVEVQNKRLPLSESDMALFREKAFPKLGHEIQLLWVALACTGMRPSEVGAITEEYTEDKTRYLIVGRKSASSRRRVPIPDALLPFLPTQISGPILAQNHVMAGKRLLRALRTIGITDERKVVYSLRHRAHDRLRAAGCPREIALQIVGHDEVTVHDGYGRGHPVADLKAWIDRIGY